MRDGVVERSGKRCICIYERFLTLTIPMAMLMRCNVCYLDKCIIERVRMNAQLSDVTGTYID